MNHGRHCSLFLCRRHYSFRHDNLLRLLHSPPPPATTTAAVFYASLLQTCATTTTKPSFSLGLQLHGYLLKSGIDADRFVCNSLLSFYLRHHSTAAGGDLSAAVKLFESTPNPDVIAWTSLMSAHLRCNSHYRALQMFDRMFSDTKIFPNAFTLSIAVKACSNFPLYLPLGRAIHGVVLRQGLGSNRVIASALVDMYGRNSSVDEAVKVFDEMHEPDSICWTSIVSALTRNDRYEDALWFFRAMIGSGNIANGELAPDEFTFGTVLAALGNLSRAVQGKQAHGWVIVSSLSGHVVVASSLVDMYAKCKLMEESQKVFDRMLDRNAVSWCALLGGYCQSGDYKSVLSLFQQMEKVSGDHYSFSTVLRACSGLSAVRQGKEVHCQFVKTGGCSDVVVESALVDLYAKSGLIDYAYRVFMKVPVRNLITWNSMVCGFAQNGRAEQAIKVFDEMASEGMKPDYISFIGVLFACGHTGMVEEGRRYFRSMTGEYSIRPGIEHYSCMVDLFSRVGLLEEAEDLINSSPFDNDSSLWTSLLGACATYSNASVGERVAKKMMQLEPRYHLSYVLLANVYKKVGRWDDAAKVRRLMRERGAMKEEGKSWLEVKGHKFFLNFPIRMLDRSDLLKNDESSSEAETESFL